jgi:hypothetical protein
MNEFLLYGIGSFAISMLVFVFTVLISRIMSDNSEERTIPSLSANGIAFSNVIFGAFIAIGSAFMSAGIALLIGIFPIFEDLLKNPNPNFFPAYMNMIMYMTYGGLILIIFAVAGAYVTLIRRGTSPPITSSKKIHTTQSSLFVPLVNNYKVFFGLGFLILFLAIVALVTPILNDHDAVQTWVGFDIQYQNVHLNGVSVSVVALENTQLLHIYYSVDQIKGEKPFLMFVIPYQVAMTNTEESYKYSLPGEWKRQYLPGIKATVMSKIFDCTGRDKYCNDQLNMYFEFKEPIDSKQYFRHSIDIPFQKIIHPGLIDIRNEMIVPSIEITNSWQTDRTTLLKVSVLDDSTEYNPIPDGYLELNKYNETRVSNSVMVWDVPDKNILFHLDYVNPDEQKIYDTLTGIALLLLGTSASTLVLATTELISHRRSK